MRECGALCVGRALHLGCARRERACPHDAGREAGCGPRGTAGSWRMSWVDTVLVVKSLVGEVDGTCHAAAPPSGSEVGHGLVLLLLMLRVEALLLGAERPGLVQQLARGAAGHLQRLARRPQALVERFDGRVVVGGAERGHVQRRAQPPLPSWPMRGRPRTLRPDSRGIGASPT